MLFLRRLKPKNFGERKFWTFFCPNINLSEILSCPKLFPAEIFRKNNFSFFFFFAVTQMKIYIEDQFLGSTCGKKEHNTVEMVCLLCI